MPLRAPGHHLASDPLFAAPLPAAPRYQPIAGGGDGDKPKRPRVKAYPLGYFKIDLAEVHTAEGRLYLLVAIDHATKFAFVELVVERGSFGSVRWPATEVHCGHLAIVFWLTL